MYADVLKEMNRMSEMNIVFKRKTNKCSRDRNENKGLTVLSKFGFGIGIGA